MAACGAPSSTRTLLKGRVSGVYEWLCPNCHGMTRTLVDPRHPYVQCCMSGCRRTFPIGLVGWTTPPSTLPPFNGLLYDVGRVYDQVKTTKGVEDRVSYTFNVMGVDVWASAKPLVARLVGPVDWTCQDCGAMNLAYPDWLSGLVVCADCGHRLWLAAGMMPSRQGLHQHPVDWVGLRQRRDPLKKYSLKASRSLRGRRRVRPRLTAAPIEAPCSAP